MKVLILLIVVVAATAFDFPEEWIKWKELYNKEYDSELLEIHRHIIWQANKKYIDEHNAQSDLFGYTVGLNQFSDLEGSELPYMHIGIRRDMMNFEEDNSTKVFHPSPEADQPIHVDWRTSGAVTRVKNQGNCNSCYAFSATGAVEGAHRIATGRLISLSEQQIVDCAHPYGNLGCRGGWPRDSFRYLIPYGSQTETSYPYEGRDNRCRYNPSQVAARIRNYATTPSGNEIALRDAIATKGPISVVVDARDPFRHYTHGIYYNPYCSPRPTTQLHAVLVVGYSTYYGQDYYIVKNSWGPHWGGEGGYIYMSRNRGNNCGIATWAVYPIV